MATLTRATSADAIPATMALLATCCAPITVQSVQRNAVTAVLRGGEGNTVSEKAAPVTNKIVRLMANVWLDLRLVYVTLAGEV